MTNAAPNASMPSDDGASSPPRANVLIRTVVHGVAVLVILGVGATVFRFLATQRKPPTQVEIATPVPIVDVAPVKLRDEVVMLTGYGTVRVGTTVDIRSQVGGEIVATYPRLKQGVQVKRGETLVQFDDGDYALRQAMTDAEITRLENERKRLQTDLQFVNEMVALRQESVALAQAEYERIRTLFTTNGIGTQTDVERRQRETVAEQLQLASLRQTQTQVPLTIATINAQQSRLRSQLALDKRNVQRCRLVAPFDGRVTAVNVERGDVAQVGALLLTLANDQDREIRIALDSRDVRKWFQFADAPNTSGWFPPITPTPAVVTWVDGDSTLYPARVDRIANFDANTRMTTVVVRLETPSDGFSAFPLTDGMFCKVDIPGRTEPAICHVPRSAVTPDGHVYVVTDGRLNRRAVNIVRDNGESLWVNAGLQSDELLVTNRLHAPVAGMAVVIRNATHDDDTPVPDPATVD